MEQKGGAYTSTLKQYQAKADYFACACLQKNDGYNVHLTPGQYSLMESLFDWLTILCLMAFYLLTVIPKHLSAYISIPGGLMYVREWNNMQYASTAAFLLAVYSDYISAANAKHLS